MTDWKIDYLKTAAFELRRAAAELEAMHQSGGINSERLDRLARDTRQSMEILKDAAYWAKREVRT